MAFCINCGTKLPENAAFCTECGTPVIKPEAAEEEKTYTVPDYQQEFYRKKEEEQQQYQYQQYTEPQNAGIKANVAKRDIAMCILLSVVTCGIYGIYWLYNIINDVNSLNPDGNEQSALTVILLSIITCGIYSYFWYYKAGQKLDTVKQMNGETDSSFSLIFVILAVLQLSIVNNCLIQNELNKLSDAG